MEFLKKPFWRVIVLLCLFGIVSVSFSMYSKQQFDKWQTAPGTFISYEVERGHSRRGFSDTIYVYYTYTVGGKHYDAVGYVDSESTVEYQQPGSDVEVWYNPGNPSESSYLKPAPYDGFVPLGFGMLVCIAAVIIVRMTPKSRRD